VRVLSRRTRNGMDRAGHVTGDLLPGEGIEAAVDGAGSSCTARQQVARCKPARYLSLAVAERSPIWLISTSQPSNKAAQRAPWREWPLRSATAPLDDSWLAGQRIAGRHVRWGPFAAGVEDDSAGCLQVAAELCVVVMARG